MKLTALGGLGLAAPLPSGAEVSDVSSEAGHPMVLVGPAQLGYEPDGSLYVYTTGPGSDVRETLAETREHMMRTEEAFIAFTHESTTSDGWVLRWQSTHTLTGEIRESLLVRREFDGAIWDCAFNSLVASTVAGGQTVCAALQPAAARR